MSDYAPECPPQLRRRGKHRAKIALADFLKIAHAVIVGHEKHADVAKEFRVGRSRVSQIVGQVLKNKELLTEMHGR